MKRQTDLAWLAGMVDGEGSILAQVGRGGVLNLVLKVANTNLIGLLACQQIAGCGKIKSIGNKPNPFHKEGFVWIISGNHVRTICEELSPYLRMKKPQADLVSNWPIGKRRVGYKMSADDKELRRDIRAGLQSLNRKGKIMESSELVETDTPYIKMQEASQLRLIGGQ